MSKLKTIFDKIKNSLWMKQDPPGEPEGNLSYEDGKNDFPETSLPPAGKLEIAKEPIKIELDSRFKGYLISDNGNPIRVLCGPSEKEVHRRLGVLVSSSTSVDLFTKMSMRHGETFTCIKNSRPHEITISTSPDDIYTIIARPTAPKKIPSSVESTPATLIHSSVPENRVDDIQITNENISEVKALGSNDVHNTPIAPHSCPTSHVYLHRTHSYDSDTLNTDPSIESNDLPFEIDPDDQEQIDHQLSSEFYDNSWESDDSPCITCDKPVLVITDLASQFRDLIPTATLSESILKECTSQCPYLSGPYDLASILSLLKMQGKSYSVSNGMLHFTSHVEGYGSLPVESDFGHLLTLDNPRAYLSEKVWEEWVRSIRNNDTFLEKNLKIIAEEIGLTWPHTRSDELVSDYISLSWNEVNQIQGFGKKKINTLLLCIAKCFHDITRQLAIGQTIPDKHQSDGTSKSKIPFTLDFEELVQTRWPQKIISKEDWKQWTEWLRDSELADRKISEIAAENGLPWPHSRMNETLSFYLNFSLRDLSNLPALGKHKVRTILLCTAKSYISFQNKVSEGKPAFGANECTPVLSDTEIGAESAKTIDEAVSMQNIEQIVTTAMGRLTEFQREVLAVRYGVGFESPSTLQETGDRFGLTRERIRQIQKKSIRIIRNVVPIRNKLNEYLKHNKASLWDAISNESYMIPKLTPMKSLSSRLPSYVLLAIECCFGSVQKWLDITFKQTEQFWYNAPYELDTLEAKLIEFRGYFHDVSFPRPMQLLYEEEMNTQLIELIISLGGAYSYYQGYIHNRPVTARVRRGIKLHHLLVAEYPFKPLPIYQIKNIYSGLFRDKCSCRDLEIVMKDNSHLFIHVGDVGWASIGKTAIGSDVNRCRLESSYEEVLYDESRSGNSHTDSLVSIAKNFISANGPVRTIDLIEYINGASDIKYVGEGAAFMLREYSGDFIRLAPGLYGSMDQYMNLDAASSTSDRLLTARACRLYVMARYAEESIGSYPMWSFAMEKRWCAWAEESGDSELFESLLYIARPESWPADENEIALWAKKKQRVGVYHFESSYGEIAKCTLPSLERIFAMIIYASEFKAINWIAVNRVGGGWLDNHGAASSLAILVGLNAVQPAKHWQRRHLAGDNVEELRSLLSCELSRKGVLNWSSQLGADLRQRILENSKEHCLNWVRTHELEFLAEELGGENSNGQELFYDDLDPLSELDSTLAKHKEFKRRDKLDSLFNSLCE